MNRTSGLERHLGSCTPASKISSKWIPPATKTISEVWEILIVEQFLQTLIPDIRVWVKEHDPQDGQRTAELVENVLAARRGHKTFQMEAQPRPSDLEVGLKVLVMGVV